MTIDQGTNAEVEGKQDSMRRPSMRSGTAASLLLGTLLLAGCSKRDSDTKSALNDPVPVAKGQSSGGTNPNPQIFEVRGVVQSIRDTNTVSIAHEEIRDYMPAMTMDFDVKNTNELTRLTPNDQVLFRMIVTETEGWIENIRKIGTDVTSIPARERPKMRAVREVEPLNAGDKMPDYTFTNSFGQKISLSDFKGQSYAFTFIFTRCPFPNFCPRMNMNFAAAYDQLSKMPNGPTNWHLISVSFDPDFDTAARLADYSKVYKPNPEKWSWVTGAMIDIDAIAEQVGLLFSFENSTFNHNLRTVIVDKNGLIRKNLTGNEWKPEELVKEIVAGAEGKKFDEY
jgi:protein SCO1